MSFTMRGMRFPVGISQQWRVFLNRLKLADRMEFEEYAAALEFEQNVGDEQADYLAAEWILLLKPALKWKQNDESDHDCLERYRASLQEPPTRGVCCEKPNGECECVSPYGRAR